MGWQWSATDRQYVDTSSGDVITKDALAILLALFVAKMRSQFRDAAAALLNDGGSPPDEWETELQPIVDQTQAISYQLARGGSNAMSEGDWAAVAVLIAAQYGYLNAFAADAGTGQLTEEQAADRAGMYADGARGGYAKGLGSAWDISLPVDLPVHPNCFPAGTIVSGPRAIGSTSRWYEGDLVEISFSSGAFLSVTPNHPILTPEGWVAAGELREGGDVICRRAAQGEQLPIHPDYDDTPSLIEDVAKSFGGTLFMPTVSVPVAAEDFHGDGIGSKVCVVRTNGLLWDSGYSSFAEPNSKQFFGGRNTEPPFLTSLRALASFGPWLDSPSDGIVGGFSLGASLLRSHSSGSDEPGFTPRSRGHFVREETATNECAPDPERMAHRELVFTGRESFENLLVADGDLTRRAVPEFDAGFREALSHRESIDVELASDCAYRLPAGISNDRILNTKVISFSGHVYNLQTKDGWYIANGIVTHNCECFWDIQSDLEGVKAYYQTVDPCPVCAGYADQYNPYDPSRGD